MQLPLFLIAVLLKPFSICAVSNYFQTNNDNQIFNARSDINIGLLIKNCANASENESTSLLKRTLSDSAVWTTERLNFLEFTSPLRLGLTIFEICTENDYYNSIFKLFQEHEEHFLLGVISTNTLPEKTQDFCNVLEVDTKFTVNYWISLIKVSVKLLNSLNWKENITVVAPNQDVLINFFRYTRREWMCVKHYLIYEKYSTIILKNKSGPVVIFADNTHIKLFLNNLNLDEEYNLDLILVPLDGSYISKDLPEGSYVVEPPYSDNSKPLEKTLNISPTPIIFEIANPILNYAFNITNFINDNCNDTQYKLNCFRKKFSKFNKNNLELPPSVILDTLKIQPLKNKIVYNIFKIDNTSKNNGLVKMFTYNIFDDSLIELENLELNNTNLSTPKQICAKPFEKCIINCINFKQGTISKTILTPTIGKNIKLRPEAWVFSFLALAVLGVLFCISIFIFFSVRVYKRDVLEGNPMLSIILLISVLLMYCSVIPFTLEGENNAKEPICLTRALSVTLIYAIAFALILSRSILLATVSKEIGFMSHIAGPVQSFLCLFIFGVQAALSLQIIGHCDDIFRGFSFLYLLSYNVMLIILLICICPLIMKSQRNYREGKYFTVATLLIGCIWGCWLPGYALLEEEWRDPLVCLGLVTTASILMGCLFIPRTYLMTIAAARDRLTSALPSLATATSAMDIYRASTQPVYDCVNVAAINAANLARASVVPPATEQSNFYSCPTLPEDGDDFDVQRCDTPVSPDKITRF